MLVCSAALYLSILEFNAEINASIYNVVSKLGIELPQKSWNISVFSSLFPSIK